MDLDRSKFLLRSYLRIRLQKIEKYIFHILATAKLYNRLSKQEKAFAKTVLLKLPNKYQSIFKQSMISEENDMGTHIIFFPHFIHLCVFRFTHVCVCFGIYQLRFSKNVVASALVNA
ncbi:putative GINS subunit, domain A protein [Rosa chinensis]|uniref:Putative GINS subunit, domain A protein n=1 Tax=Rosa chinensis TaxID=74649 RepID=A0A2P6PLT4_ROSCH|nr:putative GINS subunit, domain A protein [Rosa chinensis]